MHRSIICNPLYVFPCFISTSYLYFDTNRFTLPYLHLFLDGYNTSTTVPSAIVGSSLWLFFPGLVSCPATISSQKISQTSLNIWSFCNRSLSSTSNWSPELILGCSTSEIDNSPVSLEIKNRIKRMNGLLPNSSTRTS